MVCGLTVYITVALTIMQNRTSIPSCEPLTQAACLQAVPGRTIRVQAACVCVVALLIYTGLTHHRVFLAGNDASRFATIEAVVDFHQTWIDRTHCRWTVDRVTIGEHDYSNKPPLLSLVGAGAYAVVKVVTGWSFSTQPERVIYLLTLLLVGLPAALLVAQFFLVLGLYPELPVYQRVAVTAALLAGTILTSFVGTLNNHVPAAVLLFAAFAAALRGQGVRAGLWSGLAVGVDVLPGLGVAPVCLWILRGTGGWRALWRAAGPLGAVALLLLAANYYVLGSLWLPKLVPGAVDHSANFAAAAGGVLLPENWTYPLECLVGGHGFFSVSPVLVLGAAGLATACCRPGPLCRNWARWLAVAMGAQILGHILLAGSYGGWSYGFRYLIPIIPLLLLFVPAILNRWGTRLFVFLLPLSVLFALLGAYHPWPPAYEQEANKDPVASLVTNPVGANAAAWVAARAPASRVARVLGTVFIDPDPQRRRQYLALFFYSRGDVETARQFQVPAKALPP